VEFKRRKVKGRSSETYKEWVSDCGFFRITWINEYSYKHYQACVKVESTDGVHPFRWDFAYRRGPHKTFKKAVESCERNKRLWDAFVKLSHSTGRRDGKLLELKCRAPTVFFSLPMWVRKEADPALIRMLYPCPGSPSDHDESTEVSEPTSSADSSSSSASEPAEPTSGPASTVTPEADTTSPKTGMSSKGTSSRRGTSAKPAKAPAKARKKSSKASTKATSASSSKPSKSGKKAADSGAADSASSPKKRGKR
jgi:hypothetical protein